MRSAVTGTIVPLVGSLLLGACAGPAATGSASDACRPTAAAALVGKPAPDDAAMRATTGATLVRRIAPGDMVTQDFRTERITVTVSAAGRIDAARCG